MPPAAPGRPPGAPFPTMSRPVPPARLRATLPRPASGGSAPGRAGVLASALAAGLLGAAAVVLAFGTGPLHPRSLGWMLAGPLGPDPVQYLLGWTYFVRSPWGLPPGVSPAYGLEIGSSIFYADAIPLLAFALKALRGVVEVPQPFGPWLLLCGVLQGLLAWWLLGLATADPLARAAGAGLFVLQPMLLTRMGGHLALAGQWTLLAALFLALRDGRGARHAAAWGALSLVTSLVHAYLLPMVLGLWAADALARALRGGDRHRRWTPQAAEALAVPGAALLGLWVAGFFLLRSGHDAPGYGNLGLDLLAPLDGGYWSAVLPDLPKTGHDESGGSYLGLGGLLLLAAAGLAWLSGRAPPLAPALRRRWPLPAVLLAMLAFAVTHRPTLAGLQVTLFEPPGWALALAGSLRASERFFWPLAYALLFAAVAVLARTWGGRRTGLLLAALLAVQLADLRPGLRLLRSYVSGAPRDAPERLSDPFWAEAGRAYARVRAAPAANMGPHWESVARFAWRHGLPTDAVYLARIDPRAVAALRDRVAAALRSGCYEPGTLYVLRDRATLDLAAASHDPARDLLGRIEGLDVLAPGWLPNRAVPPGMRRLEAVGDRRESPASCGGGGGAAGQG